MRVLFLDGMLYHRSQWPKSNMIFQYGRRIIVDDYYKKIFLVTINIGRKEMLMSFAARILNSNPSWV